MSAWKEKGNVGGDVVISEYDRAYCCDSKEIDNSEGTDDLVLAAGYPMDDNVPEVTANHAQIDGLLIEPVTVPAGEKLKVPVLVRGPAIINEDALPAKDYAGDAWDVAQIKAALTALNSDFIFRSEPETQEEHTT